METAVIRIEGYRTVCEDRAAAFPCGEHLVLVVADGVGGRPGGGEASEAALRAVQEALSGRCSLDDEHWWAMLLAEIDSVLADDPMAGETTLVAAAVGPAAVTGASVGDSEAWLVTSAEYY